MRVARQLKGKLYIESMTDFHETRYASRIM